MAAASGDAHPWPIYNARYRVVFPVYDADGDLVTAMSTPDSEVSQDQGTFADATNEATEIATSSGMYYLDLVAGEMDTKCTAVIVKSATSGMKTTPLILYPRRFPVVRTGTAQAGAATTITLDSGASAKDDFYNGCYVNITNNSPANAQGQARRITDYVGSTKVATVEAAWGTNPSSASTFEILLTDDTGGDNKLWAGVAVSDPTTSGIPEVDVLHLVGDAQSAADLKDFADAGYDPATNKVQGVVLTDTLTTYTGNTVQTGDSYARLGAPAGASVSADVAAVKAETAAIVADTGTDGVVLANNAITSAKIATDAIDADALAADAVTEIWGKALSELSAVPGVTASVLDALNWVFTLSRNKIEQTSSTSTLRKDDGTTSLATSTVSDDGTTFTRGEWG